MQSFALSLVELAAIVGVPALIALYAPRRWRALAFGFWLLAPPIVLFVLALGEITREPPASRDLSLYGEALGFFVAFLVIPWAVASVAGFAIGSALRKPEKGESPKLEAAAPKPVPPAQPPPAASPSATNWRVRHIGFERDRLVINGVDVWAVPWQTLDATGVELPHPAHPRELHRFSVYEANDGRRDIRFAAAELSNGVWGFYTPGFASDPPPVGLSADGSLQFENRFPDVSGAAQAHVAPTARLFERATRKLLADGSAWTSSRILPQADGELLFALRHNDRDALFRIDGERRRFRTLGERNAGGDLSELAAAIDRAHRACLDKGNAHSGLRLAPDGSLRVDLAAVEWSNSHWVNSPRVTDVATGKVLLDLFNTDWDAEVTFPREAAVSLALRRYRAEGSLTVEIDLTRDSFAIVQDRPGPPVVGRLKDLPRALKAASRHWTTVARPIVGKRRTAPRQYGVALLILIGALAAIAAIAYVAVQLNPPTPQKLTPIPPMPDQRPLRP